MAKATNALSKRFFSTHKAKTLNKDFIQRYNVDLMASGPILEFLAYLKYLCDCEKYFISSGIVGSRDKDKMTSNDLLRLSEQCFEKHIKAIDTLQKNLLAFLALGNVPNNLSKKISTETTRIKQQAFTENQKIKRWNSKKVNKQHAEQILFERLEKENEKVIKIKDNQKQSPFDVAPALRLVKWRLNIVNRVQTDLAGCVDTAPQTTSKIEQEQLFRLEKFFTSVLEENGRTKTANQYIYSGEHKHRFRRDEITKSSKSLKKARELTGFKESPTRLVIHFICELELDRFFKTEINEQVIRTICRQQELKSRHD